MFQNREIVDRNWIILRHKSSMTLSLQDGLMMISNMRLSI